MNSTKKIIPMTVTEIKKDHKKIIEYYEEAGLDYKYWSPSFNMHFGFFKWGMNPFNLESMLNKMNEEVMNRLHLERYVEPLVLDLGCGVGATSRYIAERNPEVALYGITITPWQVIFGNRLNHKAFLAHQIDISLGDYTNLNIADDYAEGAYAIESACYAKGTTKKDFIHEMYRVLKPGAKFVITDGFRMHSKPLPGWLDGIYRKNMECWALEELADIHLFVETLKAAGFKNIVVEDVSWKVAPSFAHIPKTVIRFFWNRWFGNEKTPLTTERKNNAFAPLYGMLMGLARKHFGYYIISGEK